jgi:hypothetical protein
MGRQISDLELKIKFPKEYLENGGIPKINSIELAEDLSKVSTGPDGKVDTDTISTSVNAFMSGLLMSHRMPPVFHNEFISNYSSLLQKENFFDQIKIDTIEQFDKIYDEFKDKNDVLFRGQREAKWRLYSKIQRRWINEKLFKTKNSFSSLIEKLVWNGTAKYSSQIKKLLKIHHIDNLNAIAVLGFLQHHGCPTPLLDWTYSFQNALFFGVDGLLPRTTTIEIDNYFSIYHIEEKHFSGGNMRTLIDEGLTEIEQPLLKEMIASIAKNEEMRREMEEHFSGRKLFDRKKIEGSGLIKHMTRVASLMGFPIAYFSDKESDSGIIFSLNNSKNILNQKGVFTWNSDPSKPLEMVGDEQFKSDDQNKEANYKFCSCININKDLVSHIENRLKSDGITRDLIYPTTSIDTSEIFMESAYEKDRKGNLKSESKRKKKKRKRTNREIVAYWLKRRRKKSTRIKRKKRKDRDYFKKGSNYD